MTATRIRSVRWHRVSVLILGLATIVVLPACSAVRVTYSQLDWLMAKRIGDYVELTSEQRLMVRDHIDAILAWHCGTQLGEYATWLRRVRVDFADGITAAQLDMHSAELEHRWRSLMQHLIPAGAEVLATLSEDQVVQLLKSVAKKNSQYRKQYVESADTAWRQAHRQRMEAALRRALGELTHAQQDAIARWAAGIVPTRELGWAERLRWQRELGSLLERRHDSPALTDGLTHLLIRWQTHRVEAYRQIYALNRDRLFDLLISVSRTATRDQKRHFTSRIEKYAKDFDSLACTPGSTARSTHAPTRYAVVRAMMSADARFPARALKQRSQEG